MNYNKVPVNLREAIERYDRGTAAARAAADGDSNDAEIEALQEVMAAADEALALAVRVLCEVLP